MEKNQPRGPHPPAGPSLIRFGALPAGRAITSPAVANTTARGISEMMHLSSVRRARARVLLAFSQSETHRRENGSRDTIGRVPGSGKSLP